MSYVNLWKHGTSLPTDRQRHLAELSVREIFRVAESIGIDLADVRGEGITGPHVDGACISFNGLHQMSHAGFRLVWNGSNDTGCHCNTGRKPYDAVVVAILITLETIFDGFSWCSDGDGELGFRQAADDLLAMCSSHDVLERQIADRERQCFRNIWEMGPLDNNILDAFVQRDDAAADHSAVAPAEARSSRPAPEFLGAEYMASAMKLLQEQAG